MSLPPSNGKTVLITGINGYIASVLGLHFLSRGYSLRGTTRVIASAAPLLSDAYAAYTSRVELIEVPDMKAQGAFDEAVKGVFAIHHTASPADLSLQSWDEWVLPATVSCTEILRSAATHAGPQLESIIFLSSAVVSIDPRRLQNSGRVGSDQSGFAEAQRQGMEPHVAASRMYQTSKTMAEKSVWRWKNEHQPSFAVCSVCPGVVTGPPVQPPATASALSGSVRPVWELFSGSALEILPSTGSNEYVDVRDVAKIHLWCMEHPDQIANQRYVASAGLGPRQAVADILRRAYPERESIIPRGKPGEGYRPDFGFFLKNRKCNGTKASEAMGIQYITYDQSIIDTAIVLERYLES